MSKGCSVVKKLFLAGVAALSMLNVSMAADENDPPPPPRFQPWQQVWQCNDVRVTITGRDPYSVEYDIGGMIWGGSRFTVIKGQLFFNTRPCLPLQPIGY
jgi:uracil DNA glycosylase